MKYSMPMFTVLIAVVGIPQFSLAAQRPVVWEGKPLALDIVFDDIRSGELAQACRWTHDGPSLVHLKVKQAVDAALANSQNLGTITPEEARGARAILDDPAMFEAFRLQASDEIRRGGKACGDDAWHFRWKQVEWSAADCVNACPDA
jgi:hypothetical protein